MFVCGVGFVIYSILAVCVEGVNVGSPCSTSSECAADECCVSYNQPRGKRSLGHCQKQGTSGSLCYVHELNTGVLGLYYDCPCASGYACKGTGMHEVPKGERGTCELSSLVGKRALNQPCSSGADCPDTQCCVSDNRPIGKREMHGHCSAMGDSGAGCLVRYGSGKPDAVVFSCPCYANLTCHGTGIYDVPLGEIGKCGL